MAMTGPRLVPTPRPGAPRAPRCLLQAKECAWKAAFSLVPKVGGAEGGGLADVNSALEFFIPNGEPMRCHSPFWPPDPKRPHNHH